MQRMSDFMEELRLRTERINEDLSTFLPEEEGPQRTILTACNYSVENGGKRLRPIFMECAYELFGGREREKLLPLMAAIEMIHTYSLVHDDLPALDNDEYRRGRKTTHVVFGEDMAILTGDALLNYAFETACRAFDQNPGDSARIGQALKILAGKAGIYGMIGGQTVDVKESGHRVSGEVLDFIYRLKTGALIESSMMIGAVLAGAGEDEITRIGQIGLKIGLAFQIQDDILDVTGTEENLGKPVHSDEKNEKMTYVVWKGLEESASAVKQMTEEALEELGGFRKQDDFLEQLLRSLVCREK